MPNITDDRLICDLVDEDEDTDRGQIYFHNGLELRPVLQPIGAMLRPGDPPYRTGTVALYRFYSDHAELLYLGISNRPRARWTAHQSMAEWWRNASVVTLEICESRSEALEKEAFAIRAEEPIFNIAGA